MADSAGADPTLVDRLAALPDLAEVPREEMEWLVAHGQLEAGGPGTVIAPKDERIEKLWIILSGHIAVRVDRGVGPKRVVDWRSGEVSGMLPYSRMSGPPGDNYFETATELLTIHERHFPEMIHRCPAFTAYTVHTMLDRARSFNTSDLQDEKMVSLGKLAAGLAHELNNPASAALRGAKVLRGTLADADAASRELGAAGLPEGLAAELERLRVICLDASDRRVLSALEQADREDELGDWLLRHGADADHAAPLAEAALTLEQLDGLAERTSPDVLDTALRWIVAGCTTQSLTVDIEQAATRIHELVSTIKKFTYMDHLPSQEPVDVETGLRDTVRITAAKARAKGASVALDVEDGLPPVQANGGELNQVWLNLLDNALDAIGEGGSVVITGHREVDRVVVRFVDDGPGIPRDLLRRIFDPFFTTKPPGQGTGLGLDIARRLLRRYHGELGVESRPGRTEFRVSLLCEDPDPLDSRAGSAEGAP